MVRKVNSEQHFGLTYIATGHQYFQCSTLIPAGDIGPPKHSHANESEGFYVVEGTLDLEIDGDLRVIGEGEFAIALPGQSHTWSNRSKSTTELIVTFSPAGIEQMFRELSEPNADFVTIGQKFGMTILD